MDEQKKTPKNIKLGFLGDSNVRKTSICTIYVGIEFTEDTLTTIGLDKFDSKIALNDGNKIKLFLWDTSGQERFRSSAFRVMRVVHGIILVFDLTSRQTFENIDKWLNDIRDNFDRPFLVLFGNKADKEKEKREVSNEEIEEFVKKNDLTYFETSAKTGQGINEGLSYIANKAYDKICLDLKKQNEARLIEFGRYEEYYDKNQCICIRKKKRRRII